MICIFRFDKLRKYEKAINCKLINCKLINCKLLKCLTLIRTDSPAIRYFLNLKADLNQNRPGTND